MVGSLTATTEVYAAGDGDLVGEVDAQTTCTLTLNGTEAPLTVVVTEVDGLRVGFQTKD